MTLQQVIEQAVADAFLAGAEWHAIVWTRQDSAAVGHEARTWRQDHRFQRSVQRHQKAATEAEADVFPAAVIVYSVPLLGETEDDAA